MSMRSRAGRKLEERLRDINELVEAHKKLGGKRKGRRWNLAALNRSAIVLTCAHLEGFLEELFAEAMDHLLTSRVKASSIPDEIKLVELRRLAQPIMKSDNPQTHDTALKRILTRAGKFGHPRKQIGRSDVDYTSVVGGFSNPTTARINWLFRQMGLVDILSDVSWTGCPASKVPERIQALVGKRNSIAHGNLDTGASRGEVESCYSLLRHLGEELEERVRRHLEGLTGRSPW